MSLTAAITELAIDSQYFIVTAQRLGIVRLPVSDSGESLDADGAGAWCSVLG